MPRGESKWLLCLCGVSLLLAALFTGLIFTGDVTTDKGALIEIPANASVITEITKFVFETSIYVYVHHTMNFLFFEYFMSSILYILHVWGNSSNPPQHSKKVFYIGEFLAVLGGAALWESVEKFLVWLFIVLAETTEWGPFVYARNFFNTGEDIWNTLLSDLPQAMSAVTGGLILYYITGRKPLAFLVHTRSMWKSLFMFVWYLISLGCAVVAAFKTSYGDFLVPYGLFVYLSLQIMFVTVMYWVDTNLSQDILTAKEIKRGHLEMAAYLATIGASTCFLVVPGFITSNVFFILYIFGVYVYYQRFVWPKN